MLCCPCEANYFRNVETSEYRLLLSVEGLSSIAMDWGAYRVNECIYLARFMSNLGCTTVIRCRYSLRCPCPPVSLPLYGYQHGFRRKMCALKNHRTNGIAQNGTPILGPIVPQPRPSCRASLTLSVLKFDQESGNFRIIFILRYYTLCSKRSRG